MGWLLGEFLEYFMNRIVNWRLFVDFDNPFELSAWHHIIAPLLVIELGFHEELENCFNLDTVISVIFLNLVVLDTEIHIGQLLIIPFV